MPSLIIADDNLEFANFLQEVAKAAGWSVSICGDGHELLRALDEIEESALVLIDIQMPNLDGIEVAMRLRDMDQSRKLRLRFVTGGLDVLAVAARVIVEAGNYDPGKTLHKPISLAQFRAVLDEEARLLSEMGA